MTRKLSQVFNNKSIIFACAIFFLTFSVQLKPSAADDSEITPDQIIFVVLTQPNSFHVKRAEEFRKHFTDQLSNIDKKHHPKLILTHEADVKGAWTFFPVLKLLEENYEDKAWVFICEEETRLNIKKLTKLLNKFDHTKKENVKFLGFSMQ